MELILANYVKAEVPRPLIIPTADLLLIMVS
jgi:hypothetical protein